MSEKIVVPALGESVTEATIAKWLKSVGDTVEVDEPIVELETDKVNLEVPSPVSGTIGDIKHKDGEVVEVGAVLGSIQANGNETVQEIKKIEPDVKIKEAKDPPKKKVEKIAQEVKPLKLEEEIEDETSLEEEPLVLTEEIPSNGSRKNNLSNTLSPSVRKIVAEIKMFTNRKNILKNNLPIIISFLLFDRGQLLKIHLCHHLTRYQGLYFLNCFLSL